LLEVGRRAHISLEALRLQGVARDVQVIDVAEHAVQAVDVQGELVEVVVFEDERKALPDVPAAPMDLLILIQESVQQTLIFELAVSKLVSVKEFRHRFTVVIDVFILIERVLLIKYNDDIFGEPERI